jgi:hypothetical protein
MTKSQDDLWPRVEAKLGEAQTVLADMSRCLQGPERTHVAVVLEASGAIVGHDWQSSFYSLGDSFLAKARSVAWIIEACFGNDSRGSAEMRAWWQGLSPDEQRRRTAFSEQFRADKKAFSDHPLTTERNVSEHRLGSPNIEGKVHGPFGQVHTANPTSRIPDAESRPLEPNISDDAALQWAATLPAQPVRARPEQFTIGGKPLFSECQNYLALARELANKARSVAGSVHANTPFTIPPSS